MVYFLMIVLPIIYMVLGFIFYKRPPKKINDYVGFRTKSSMSSQGNFDYANRLNGICYLILGVVLLILTILSFIFIYDLNETKKWISATIISVVQLLGLIYPTLYTSYKLKQKIQNEK